MPGRFRNFGHFEHFDRFRPPRTSFPRTQNFGEALQKIFCQRVLPWGRTWVGYVRRGRRRRRAGEPSLAARVRRCAADGRLHGREPLRLHLRRLPALETSRTWARRALKRSSSRRTRSASSSAGSPTTVGSGGARRENASGGAARACAERARSWQQPVGARAGVCPPARNARKERVVARRVLLL